MSARDDGRPRGGGAPGRGIRPPGLAARAGDGREHPGRGDLERVRGAADLGDRLHRGDAARRSVHRRQRHARIRAELHDRAAGGSRGLCRGDRHGQHVLDRDRRPHPAHRAAAADRRVGPRAARRSRTAGARRRCDRRVPGTGRRHGGRGGRRLARRPDAGARRDRLHPGAAAAADPRRDRRAHHLGGGVGWIAPRARGDAAAGAGRVGRGLPRPGRPPARGATSGRSRSSSRAGRCWPPASRSGCCRRSAWSWPSSAASCRSPDSRSAPRS